MIGTNLNTRFRSQNLNNNRNFQNRKIKSEKYQEKINFSVNQKNSSVNFTGNLGTIIKKQNGGFVKSGLRKLTNLFKRSHEDNLPVLGKPLITGTNISTNDLKAWKKSELFDSVLGNSAGAYFKRAGKSCEDTFTYSDCHKYVGRLQKAYESSNFPQYVAEAKMKKQVSIFRELMQRNNNEFIQKHPGIHKDLPLDIKGCPKNGYAVKFTGDDPYAAFGHQGYGDNYGYGKDFHSNALGSNPVDGAGNPLGWHGDPEGLLEENNLLDAGASGLEGHSGSYGDLADLEKFDAGEGLEHVGSSLGDVAGPSTSQVAEHLDGAGGEFPVMPELDIPDISDLDLGLRNLDLDLGGMFSEFF